MTLQIRSIDGSGNNVTHPEYNSAGGDFIRDGAAHFADGISEPIFGENPREISNIVIGEGDPEVLNARHLSNMVWAWGQFIDHDLDLQRPDGVNHIDISHPDGTFIPLTRVTVDPLTGAGTTTPATAINTITGWLDGSMVYGSSQAVADSLKAADGAHLATSEGNNLPIVNGGFVAGDVRATENTALTSLQTLFVREHNFQVDKLAAEHPTFTAAELYEQARATVGAEIAHITYDEWLPLIVGKGAIQPYSGYHPEVDPRISEEFAGAAFRMGHSIVDNEVEKIAADGLTTVEVQSLAEAFNDTPFEFNQNEGADGILRYLVSSEQPAMDARIVDGLRDFLVDGAPLIDLAAVNIQRGVDMGLGSLNETRHDLGLSTYQTFNQITDDRATVAALKQAFDSVDDIPLWVGGLSERAFGGGIVGQTFGAIIADQFEDLRDGDRFWYERAGFTSAELKEIKATSLSDLIERNTDTLFDVQDSAFKAVLRGSEDDAASVVVSSETLDPLQVLVQHESLLA